MNSIKIKLAYIFTNLFPNKYKFVEEVNAWYSLDEVTKVWKVYEEKLLLNVIGTEFPTKLCIEFENQYQQIEELFILDILYDRQKINKLMLWLKSQRNVKSLISELKLNYYTSNLTIFNSNPMVLLFKNEIMLDLNTKKTEQITSDHLISNMQMMNINYEEVDENKMIIIKNMFKSIVDKKMKQSLVKVLYESLIGINPRKIMICHGSNSKIFLESFLNILGTYGISLPDKLLYTDGEFTKNCLYGMKISRAVLFKNVDRKSVV